MITLPQLLIALGCGLIIGIERERRKTDRRAFAGVRSFSLTAVLGALSHATELAIPAALLIAGLSIVSYQQINKNEPSVITQLALFLSFVIGAVSLTYPEVAAAAAVIVALTLNWRNDLHHFAQVQLSSAELRDALLLAAAALVALPLLPNEPLRWLLGANPRRLWGLVVVLMCLQAAGYIALRVVGPRLGLALSGFGSGFVSSTATTAAMGLRAKQQPALLHACVSGALLSTVATFVLLFVVTVTVAPSQLASLSPSIFSALLCACLMAGISMLGIRDHGNYVQPEGHAFSLREALVFAFILTTATALVALANDHFGSAAVQLSAALAGLVDVHAAAASLLTLSLGTNSEESGASAAQVDYLLAILVATSTNTVSKIVAASISGGKQFAIRTGAGLLCILAAAWLPYFWRLAAS